tara:strand:+ start:2436 stop:3554 length:1119 start_codon:yes stop_codon:yes gene_type:complete
MSMMDYRQHSVEPENAQDTYGEFNQVDFRLSFEGRKIELNTLRLLGNITLSGTGVTNPDDLRVENFAGAHVFCQEILSSTANQGLVESISNYPRYVAMQSRALNQIDNQFSSRDMCELKSYGSRVSGEKFKGVQIRNVANNATIGTNNMDFSIRPLICFNNAEGDQYMPHTKSGDLVISIRLCRNADFAFGGALDATSAYSLDNLRLTFNSIPDDGQDGGRVLGSKIALEQVIDSSLVNISATVPGVCTGVSCSAIQSNKLSDVTLNNLQQERIPDITALSFLFNNSQSEYITYEIRNNVDLNQRYLESFLMPVKNNQSQQEVLNSNDSFGIGLNFQDQVDLSSQKFGLELESSVNSVSYILYMYFHALVQM